MLDFFFVYLNCYVLFCFVGCCEYYIYVLYIVYMSFVILCLYIFMYMYYFY